MQKITSACRFQEYWAPKPLQTVEKQDPVSCCRLHQELEDPTVIWYTQMTVSCVDI